MSSISLSAHAATWATATEPYAVQLAAGAHAYVQPDGGWCLNNAGFVSDGRTTVMIDTAATERRARALREAVLASGAPLPQVLVNTHHHGDHTYGNAVFLPEATIVGHTACRAETLANGRQLHAIWPDVDFGDIHITAPTLTYTGTMALHVGEVEIQLIHPGVAHTTGDTLVWLPNQRVVYTGDLVFHGGTPFVLMGSLAGSLSAIEQLRALGAETIVPGHGPITGPDVYDTIERYLRYVAEVAAQGHAAGRPPLEVAREADLGEFGTLRESERLVANLHRAYAELDGLPPGTPLDAGAAFAEMAVLNGGRPVACHA
ncbi:MBL fold metallo-hydrolase [Streptomyces zagrosensis]|uniref:Cyclase n=1 Tax=Streptomyces zagrosensis TaxID=1042984 RepID=A0A7W9Q9X8_9ACTN|nr:MBL fold metallo-hydrolase [Streptomyces zagrosensis]MBB5936341.1 cyclase [Streptomyces zagrosensis]